MSDHRSGHDAECESELTSHGYTPCRCHERAGICYCRKSPCICAPSPALAGAQATGAQDACTVCWATAGLVRVTQHRCEKHLLLDDDDRRAAFMAGRFGRELPSGWVFHEPEWAHNADEAYAAYLVWLAQRPEAQR
jgi:hypothetical protein